jgi:hypothetical protein
LVPHQLAGLARLEDLQLAQTVAEELGVEHEFLQSGFVGFEYV